MKTNKRSRTKQYPLGIDSSKLPVGCYWDDRRKHWCTRFNDSGVRRNRIIGKETATMQDLWEAMRRAGLLKLQAFSGYSININNRLNGHLMVKILSNSYNNTIRILNEMETKTLGTFISDTNRHNWTPVLMQNMIDKIAIKTPTTSHRAKENISAIFNWGIRRGHAITNPASIVELCKLNPKQRLPSKVLVAKLTEFAINGSKLKPHTKGSIPKAIWKSLELAFLNRLRGIEVRHLTDDHILSDGLMCERAKGSSTNVTLWDDRLQYVINKCVADRDALWKKKGRRLSVATRTSFFGGKQQRRLSNKQRLAKYMEKLFRIAL